MALIKCRECGAQVSNEAKHCPHCGATPQRRIGVMGWIFIVFVGGAIIHGVSLGMRPSGSASPNTEASSDKQCSAEDVKCITDQGAIWATAYCPSEIAKLALHDVKWTVGTYDMKFSRYKWKDKKAGIMTYVGDKVEFQNGFGAYTPMIYECDMPINTRTVLAVRARSGRLPD